MTRSKGIGNHGLDKPAAKPRTVGTGFDATFRGYINLNLTEAEKAEWEKFHDTPHVLAWFDAAVSDGVHVSTRIEAKTEGFLTSCTQRRESSPNAGLVVTARGRTAWVSFSRAMFILMLLGEKETWEETQPLANPDRW